MRKKEEKDIKRQERGRKEAVKAGKKTGKGRKKGRKREKKNEKDKYHLFHVIYISLE